MEVYIDDPVLLLLGTEDECKQQAAIITLAWAAVGVVLAFSKGQVGRAVSWIGASCQSTDTGVMATILQSKPDDLLSHVKELLASNIAPIKTFRMVTGRAQSGASLLWSWRPFIHMMYAAIRSPDDPTVKKTPPSQLHVEEAN